MGATVSGPFGVTLDPASGRIYWTNFGGVNKISFANLNGSGGGDLNTGTAPVTGPIGLAFDPVGGKIYWANEGGGSIAFVNADGSGTGGGTVNTTGATLTDPVGVAIDPVARKIYWADHSVTASDRISFANLDGSGGGDLTTAPATVDRSGFPLSARGSERCRGAHAQRRLGDTDDPVVHGGKLGAGPVGFAPVSRATELCV